MYFTNDWDSGKCYCGNNNIGESMENSNISARWNVQNEPNKSKRKGIFTLLCC